MGGLRPVAALLPLGPGTGRGRFVALGGLAAAFLVAAGCNGRTHDDSDEAGDADGPKQDMGAPDMAPGDGDGDECGGADLQSDENNCGECGHKCDVDDSYGHPSGLCMNGACSPTWTLCEKQAVGDNCAQVCEWNQRTCAPQGCDGLTAIFLTEASDSAIGCVGEDMGLTIGCEEPLPWSADPFTERVFCCCEQD